MIPYVSAPYEYYHAYDPGQFQMPATHEMQEMYQMYGQNFILNNVDASQLQPILTDNPSISTLVLFKELSGFPNYGNPSGNADILYRGNRGEWTFEVPAFFFIPGLLRAQLYIRAVLDDRAATPVAQYSATITINGRVVHRGPVPLEHGRPFGQPFVNWRTLIFDVPDIRRVNRIVITNTSTGLPDDWIGLDWMEMRFFRR
ncbi:hypothetical protein [Natronincola ferrireducens]|uniref:Uncharacterized protein n=1 Tax=Natronincola ferrireducens TaxID=393762 RepID=A0A1G9GGG6_9FIRM|nr:hypothetical protein [Natronincola ferrireducens]SDK99625.1 hypothetical protein SAMN05660472_02410 [Natronincola ferrireducens]